MVVDDEESELKTHPTRKLEVEDEEEYVSDPDEQLRSCAMRRRRASDDESDGERREEGERRRLDYQGSDGDSDDQGGAPGYEDDEEDQYEEYDNAFQEHRLEYGEVRLVGSGPPVDLMKEMRIDAGVENLDEGGAEDNNQEQGGEEGEKKEAEPFTVPTAGAFYMHDDRFRENRGGGGGRGRHRRTRGGRNLWESKDELAWVHDRFEEASVQDRQYNEQRRSGRRGRYRGRGKTRGPSSRAYGRENKSQGFDDRFRIYNEMPQSHDDGSQSYDDRSQPNDGRSQPNDDRSQLNNDRFDDYSERNSQYRGQRSVRGRGPRRYESLSNNINNREDFPKNRTKQNKKAYEQKSHDVSGKQVSQSLKIKEEPVIPRKQVINSSLNSASPPFYPSRTSGQDTSMIPNRDVQTTSVSRSALAPSLSTSSVRGKETFEYPTNQDLLRIHGNTTANVLSGSSSSSAGTIHSPQFRVQDKGPSPSGGQLNYRQNSLPSQSGRFSSQAPAQPSLRPTISQLGQYHTVGGSVPPVFQVQSANVSDAAESNSPTESNNSKTMVVGKEKSISLSGNRSAILYKGAHQFIGPNRTLALGPGDQNFPGTPALLPVMQFPGQPNDGVPAVGMALPGYVAQPQMGFGGSEMQWLPMLAGANGALSSSYAPFITLDSGYARQTVQTSSSSTTKETETTAKHDNTKSSQRSDQGNEELGQRQNKPRRYSEMNFGQ